MALSEVRLVAGERGNVVVTLDEQVWAEHAAAARKAGTRVARFVGDPIEETDLAAAVEMAHELFGEALEGGNPPET